MTTPQMDWLDDQRRKRAVSSDDIVDELQFRVTVTRLGGQHAAREVMSDIMAMENARNEIVRLRAEVERLMDGMELAWAIIANGQYWDATDAARQAEWEQAKFTWRDEHWHPALDRNNEARRG